MELSELERYAVASLFTLALHASQYDGGNATADAWGEPQRVERDPRLLSYVSEAELEAWWGFDLVAPGGLLDRVFRELRLPPMKWKGLKLLPCAAPSASSDEYRQMVRGLIAMLDPDMAAALPPLLPRRPSGRLGSAAAAGDNNTGGTPAPQAAGGGQPPTSPDSAERRAAAGSLFAGILDQSDSEDDDSDEDWKADLERERKLLASVEWRQPAGDTHPLAPRRLSRDAQEVLRLSKELSGVSLEWEASGEDAGGEVAALREELARGMSLDGGEQQQQQGQQDAKQQRQDVQQPAAQQQQAAEQQEQEQEGGAQSRRGSQAVAPTPKAMGAVWELVQCCVGAQPLPPAVADPLTPPGGLPRPAAVRWYDARARVALLQVASWLQVDPRKVANLELLLTQDKAPRHKALSDLEEDDWTRRMRYFKVGAAAVGGGALFALTGGLAAPAIAAGMGSILGFIGAPTAVAGTITGFLTSTVGAATVTTTMAGAGAASTGSKMAYRTAGISEFGFRELLPAAQELAPPPPPPEEKELQPLGKQVGGGGGATDGAALEGGGDSGHLQISSLPAGGGSYRTARAAALAARPGSASSLSSSASGSNLALKNAGSAPAPSQQQQQQGAAPAPAAQQDDLQPAPSVWQRWFGGGSKKQEEELLLPVPMRVKQSGDVKLAVAIYVAGWVGQRSDFETTWQGCIAPNGDADCFSLVWETKVLLHLQSALGKLLTMQAAGQSLQLATHTSFFYAGAGLVAALGPTVLLGTASGLLISNAWAVASDRAVKAGKLLAHLLLSGAHGDRPVRLVAHGMGARLVFHCLLELCRQGARGIVQHCVLMGCPVGTEELRWRMARRAVAGRLVNAYTRRDWLLGVCAGGSSGWMRATAGLVPIEVAGVENVNLSNWVDGHFSYLEEMPAILESLNM